MTSTPSKSLGAEMVPVVLYTESKNGMFMYTTSFQRKFARKNRDIQIDFEQASDSLLVLLL